MVLQDTTGWRRRRRHGAPKLFWCACEFSFSLTFDSDKSRLAHTKPLCHPKSWRAHTQNLHTLTLGRKTESARTRKLVPPNKLLEIRLQQYYCLANSTRALLVRLLCGSAHSCACVFSSFPPIYPSILDCLARFLCDLMTNELWSPLVRHQFKVLMAAAAAGQFGGEIMMLIRGGETVVFCALFGGLFGARVALWRRRRQQ